MRAEIYELIDLNGHGEVPAKVLAKELNGVLGMEEPLSKCEKSQRVSKKEFLELTENPMIARL